MGRLEFLSWRFDVFFVILLLHIGLRGGHGLYVGNGLYMTRWTSNLTWAEEECQGHGFDGLVVPSSPEEYNYVMNITEKIRWVVAEVVVVVVVV